MRGPYIYVGTILCALGMTFGDISIHNYIYSTTNTIDTCDYETESMSLIQCTTICSQSNDCKGVGFDRASEECCVCSSIRVPDETSDSGSGLYRTTNGQSCVGNLLDDIPDDQLTASSSWSSYTGPDRARLNTTEEPSPYAGGWSAGSKSSHEYIQATFDGVKEATGMAIQGRNGNGPHPHYVTSYNVSYSVDCDLFSFIKDSDNEPKTFPGNVDRDTIVWNDFQESILAVCVRLHPHTFHGHPDLRFGVKGCDFNP